MLRVDESYNGQEIALTVGQQFEAALPENPELPFRWHIAANDGPVCALQDDYFEESLRLQTSGGSHIWLFQASQPGTAIIDLAYEKPDQPVQSSPRKFSLHVTVTP